MNILAIAAHPDDVEEMVYGTLMKYRQRGDNIYIALATSGNIGSNHSASRAEIAATREGEQLDAAKALDAKVKFMRFDDEDLIDTVESRRAFLNAIRWANPDVIFTHSPLDTSPDHNMCARLVIANLLIIGAKLVETEEAPMNMDEKKPSLFFWDIPGGFKFEPEAYVDISDVIEPKIAAIAAHKSQLDWMEGYLNHDYLESMRVQSRFRGYQYGCMYAEGFVGYQIHGFVPDLRLLP